MQAKPEQVLSLKNQSPGLRLKTSSQKLPKEVSGPPKTVQNKKSPGVTDPESNEEDRPKLRLKDSSEESPESKLSTPGSLHLKNLNENEQVPVSNTNPGLRLRRPPSSTKDEPGSEVSQTPTTETMKGDNEIPQDSISNITLKKARNDNTANKLSLAPTAQDVAIPDPTPPGLEAPFESKESTNPSTAEAQTEQARIKIDLSSDPSIITPPEQKVKFSRKRKSGLTKKQKQQIALVWLPISLIILGLGYLFISKLLITEPSPVDPSSEVEPRTSKPKPAKSTSAPIPEEKKQDQKALDSTDDKGIEFPSMLLHELEQAHGHRAKEQFIEEWQELSNKEREGLFERNRDNGRWKR